MESSNSDSAVDFSAGSKEVFCTLPSEKAVYLDGSGNQVGGFSSLVDDTTPQLGGMLDVNGNAIGDGTLELLKFSETGSAVNELTIANAATTTDPTITASGGDANVGLGLVAKGTGVVQITSSMNPTISSTGKAMVLGF